MSNITLQEEVLTEKLFKEAGPLLVEHYEELAMYKDKIKYNPDIEKYLTLQKLEMLSVVTMRDEGELIGYWVTFLTPHIHYSDHIFAMNDILLIKKSHRKGLLCFKLFKFVEKVLKNKGASVMSLHMKIEHSFDPICERLGWDYAERLYTKYIGD